MIKKLFHSGNVFVIASCLLVCGIFVMDNYAKQAENNSLRHDLEQYNATAQMQCESELTACNNENAIYKKMIAKCALYEMAERMEKR